jgi:hypothetical protein
MATMNKIFTRLGVMNRVIDMSNSRPKKPGLFG